MLRLHFTGLVAACWNLCLPWMLIPAFLLWFYVNVILDAAVFQPLPEKGRLIFPCSLPNPASCFIESLQRHHRRTAARNRSFVSLQTVWTLSQAALLYSHINEIDTQYTKWSLTLPGKALKTLCGLNQTAEDYCGQIKDTGVSLPSAVFWSSLVEMTRLNNYFAFQLFVILGWIVCLILTVQIFKCKLMFHNWIRSCWKSGNCTKISVTWGGADTKVNLLGY